MIKHKTNMRIPFNIKYRDKIESGEYKVVDKDNHNIRIICWDKKSEKKYGYHIVGLVEFGPNHEESTYYTIDGKGRLRDKHPCLFIVTPEPEMSGFEYGMLRYLQDAANKKDDSEIVESTKEHSLKLLDLAKQQLLQSGELLTQEHHEKLMETLREECKKDLPRWRNVEPDKRYVGCVTRYMDVNGDWNYCMSSGMLSDDCQYISIAALEKLPQEDESHE